MLDSSAHLSTRRPTRRPTRLPTCLPARLPTRWSVPTCLPAHLGRDSPIAKHYSSIKNPSFLTCVNSTLCSQS
jgi:hypothetical protein